MYEWIEPEKCEPPHRVTHPEFFRLLIKEFQEFGWRKGTPALLGYDFFNHIQLISGSHRWAAAKIVGIKIPVMVNSYDDVLQKWGFDEWVKMVKNPPIIF